MDVNCYTRSQVILWLELVIELDWLYLWIEDEDISGVADGFEVFSSTNHTVTRFTSSLTDIITATRHHLLKLLAAYKTL